MSIQEYLIKKGFQRDRTAPSGVNRWEKADGEVDGLLVVNRTYWASFTLSPDGARTEYGVVLFSGPFGHILQKRKFTGSLSPDDIENLMKRTHETLPENIKVFPDLKKMK